MSVVRQRFGQGIRQEVLGDVINRSLDDAFRKENLRPAGRPQIEPKQLSAGKDVEFVAVFEVYPTVELQDLSGQAVTRYSAEISDTDVDEMIEILRKSQTKWGLQRALPPPAIALISTLSALKMAPPLTAAAPKATACSWAPTP